MSCCRLPVLGSDIVITNEAQPPQTITTTIEVILKVLPRDAAARQKWLGSMLTSRGSKSKNLDLQFYLQHASKVFHMSQQILQDWNVSIARRLQILWACTVISGMLRWRTSQYVQSTFGASRTSFPEIVQVNCRPSAWYRMVTRMARNTSSMECSGEHIYRQNHHQNMVAYLNCCLSYWRLAQHIARLPQRLPHYRKSVGFDKFYDGAWLQHIELIAHIFIRT